MRTFGLLGKTLTHSLSKKYFEEKFEKEGLRDCTFRLFEIEHIEKLPTLLEQHPDLCGFTVTIPYKRDVIAYLDHIDPVAEQIGAVNVVRVQRTSTGTRLQGFNSDTLGFQQSLEGIALPHKALVLGTGGAAAAILHALREMHIEYQVVSRTAKEGVITYSDIDEQLVHEYPFIINCTPVGTLENARPPIPYEALSEQNFLYDLVYNPATTAFLQGGIEHNSKVMNGLSMLHRQADVAWRIWNDL